jgi:hypothetical protein
MCHEVHVVVLGSMMVLGAIEGSTNSKADHQNPQISRPPLNRSH